MNEEELLEIYNNFYQYYSHEDFIKMMTNKERLQRKFKDTNKGLNKVLKSRKIWKNRYYREKEKRKQDKENLIKYIEDEIKEYSKFDTKKTMKQIEINTSVRLVYQDLLERIKNNNYE